MLREEGDKETAFDMASWATGSSSERTYFIANYTHEKNEQSYVVERTALDILDFALLSAERFIRIRKQREKNQMERAIAAGGESYIRLERERMTAVTSVYQLVVTWEREFRELESRQDSMKVSCQTRARFQTL